MLPNRHKLNLAALVVSFVLLVVFVRTESVGLQTGVAGDDIIALAFGWHWRPSAVRICRWLSRC
jgi:NAD(P) transhydrogenase subunit beta